MFADATLVAIEGLDRSGKATQTKMLVEEFERRGHKTLSIEVPIQDKLTFWLIRRMLKTGSAKRWPNFFQFVQFLNKWFFQVFKFPFARRRYSYIVFDRWALSMLAYGQATGASSKFTEFLFSHMRAPHCTIYLQGKPCVSEATDTFEADNSIQGRAGRTYDAWCSISSDHHIIPATGSRVDVHRKIMSVLAKEDLL